MVSVVGLAGLLVIVLVNSAVTALMTRFFRVRLNTRWGGLLYSVLLCPFAMFVLFMFFGVLGLGGGLIFSPLFVILGFAKSAAASASLFLNLVAAGSAAYAYARKKMVDFSLSIPLIVSSALAAQLGHGHVVPEAARRAKAYIAASIAAADTLTVGSGHGPVHHFHAMPVPKETTP